MNRRCILIILLLCVLKISCQSDEQTDDDYYADEIEGSGDTSMTNRLDTSSSLSTPSSIPPSLSEISSAEPNPIQITESITEFTTVSTIVTTPVQTTYETSTTQEPIESACPKSCKCSDTFGIVDCSQQNLVEVPKNLPNNTNQLNLSHNLLTTLNVSDLINCRQLQRLDLNNNQIETIINTEDFAKLPGLHYLDLSSNALKPLQGNEFSKANKLATLNLKDNQHVIAPNVPIIQKLKTLNLANCSITQLSENIFQNLSSLVVLDLDNNPFDTFLNVKAFKYLVNLRVLNFATLPRDVFPELCKQLDSIDIVHLTSEPYDVSCLLLLTGSEFDESIIKYGQSTLSSTDTDELHDEREKIPPKPNQQKPTTQKPISSTKNVTNNLAVIDPVGPLSGQQMSIISQNETRTEKTINSTESTIKSEDATQAKVDVPQHIIYMLLIGLIAVTVVALLIGVCCRLDCCGIKTKCCRRQHNRAETEDRVQPHEEIPLNKV
ncbi:peroxidasin homolog [Contarinia nasturtii]|uniref:peroxidasin homolog n=1 Tax=Contarinia nasturtii TaxID=265458 RepID=UPI0012D38648|nr:peroxidasin homolog [Contarinia nasturtii]